MPSPIETDQRVAMYTPEFVADPHRVYREMRDRFGGLVPVDLAPGVPATLVIDYKKAVRILNDPDHFPADPRRWQETMSPECPVLPMMGYLPAARCTSGSEHARYRRATEYSVDGIDAYTVHGLVERAAIPLLNAFCEDGHADLLSQYALPLVSRVLNELVGCPAEIGERVLHGLVGRYESADEGPAGLAMVRDALLELCRLRRVEPGDDATTRLTETDLDDEEVFATLTSFFSAGLEAQRNLITNTTLLMLTDPRFRAEMWPGLTLPSLAALNETLFNDPPLANFCTTYPRQPIAIDGVWLPADQPVVVSMAACNNDPEVRGHGQRAQSVIDNKSNLAWSTGPHTCPAKNVAFLTCQAGIDQLFDMLPDLKLAVPEQALTWRPGPFHRALAALPVVFKPSPPMHIS